MNGADRGNPSLMIKLSKLICKDLIHTHTHTNIAQPAANTAQS